MFSKPAPGDVPSNGMRTKFFSARRTLLVVAVVLIVVMAVVCTVWFSSWNVCRADLDDDVDVLNAAQTSRSRRQRPDKICLSPQTDSGLRVNMSIDSDDDLRR